MTAEEARSVVLDPSWLGWWKGLLRVQTDHGTLTMPREGAVYRLRKEERSVSLIACVPKYLDSPAIILTDRCLKHLGYTHAVCDPLLTQEELARHLAESHRKGANVLMDEDAVKHAHPWLHPVFVRVTELLKNVKESDP